MTIQPSSPWTELNKLTPTPSPTNSYYADQWNPWQTLAEDYRDVFVTSKYKLPKGTLGLQKGRRIWLSSELNPLEKTCTLAHELVHMELGIGNDDERTVCEVTARRMVPFRDLGKVIGERPDVKFGTWAWHLRVDILTLRDRMFTLSATERAALSAVRGGPVPTMPHHELYDGKVA